MAEDTPMGAFALAGFTLAQALLVEMERRGLLKEGDRREIVEAALRGIEAPSPDAPGGDILISARRLLEDWM